MILLPIMINSDTIGAVYARRLEELHDGDPEDHFYHYEWEVTVGAHDKSKRKAFHAAGELRHCYGDGPLFLLAKILKEAGIS